jgi:hypothetical protein
MDTNDLVVEIDQLLVNAGLPPARYLMGRLVMLCCESDPENVVSSPVVIYGFANGIRSSDEDSSIQVKLSYEEGPENSFPFRFIKISDDGRIHGVWFGPTDDPPVRPIFRFVNGKITVF